MTRLTDVEPPLDAITASEDVSPEDVVVAEAKRLLELPEAISLKIGDTSPRPKKGDATIVVADSADGTTQFVIDAYDFGGGNPRFGTISWLDTAHQTSGSILISRGEIQSSRLLQHEEDRFPFEVARKQWEKSSGQDPIILGPKSPRLSPLQFAQLGSLLSTAVVNAEATGRGFTYLANRYDARRLASEKAPELSLIYDRPYLPPLRTSRRVFTSP